MIKYLLFDLDGTITDSADGITNSVSYALGNLGISEEKSNLYRFVGPPLVDSFKEFYGYDEKIFIKKKQKKTNNITVNFMP